MPLIESKPDAVANTYARSLFEMAEAEGGREKTESILDQLEEVGFDLGGQVGFRYAVHRRVRTGRDLQAQQRRAGGLPGPGPESRGLIAAVEDDRLVGKVEPVVLTDTGAPNLDEDQVDGEEPQGLDGGFRRPGAVVPAEHAREMRHGDCCNHST